jgi:hypothetical protein
MSLKQYWDELIKDIVSQLSSSNPARAKDSPIEIPTLLSPGFAPASVNTTNQVTQISAMPSRSSPPKPNSSNLSNQQPTFTSFAAPNINVQDRKHLSIINNPS